MAMNSTRFFWKSKKGTAAIEFAVIAPLFITFIAGLFELAMFMFLNVKLQVLASTIANNVTIQQTASRTNIQGMLGVEDTITYPFKISNKGGIVVTQIQPTAQNPNIMTISWQVASGAVSRLGSTGAVPVNVPGNITLTAGQSMIVTEVFYNYAPIIFGIFITARPLYTTAVFLPRQGTLSTLNP
jgi:Flp pilus assembly protein TadG